MKILDRYILLTFLKNYLISFMVLIGLFVVMHLVFNFDELTEHQVRGAVGTGGGGLSAFLGVISVIGDYYFYQVFLIYAQLSGVIAVVAAAFTLVRLSRFNELSPILSAGVPLARLAWPIVLAALVLNVLLIADQEVIIPRLIPKLTRKPDEIASNIPKPVDIKAMQDKDGSLLFAGRYHHATDQSPATMLVFDLVKYDKDRVATEHISADRADWDPVAQRWQLVGGMRVTGLQPTMRRSATQPVLFYQSNVTPEEIALFRSGDYVELLSTGRINDLLQRPLSYGTTALMRVKHARVTQWLMNVVAVLLGIACILTREPGRLKADGIRLVFIVGGAMMTVFTCHQLAEKPPPGAAWSNNWPAIMAWLPIFIYGPLAILLLDRMHTKRS